MKHYRKSSHVIYDIKYHIAWVTKYRYKILKGDVALRFRELTRQICSAHDVQIIIGSISADHVHIFISCPPSIAVSKVVQKIKGATSRKLQQEFQSLKKVYWGQHFWARGYFCVSSGNVTDEMWLEYIRSQPKRDPRDEKDFQIVP